MIRDYCWAVVALTVVVSEVLLIQPASHAQAMLSPAESFIRPGRTQVTSICGQTPAPRALKEALRLACLHNPTSIPEPTVGNAIVIGFVGGFVKQDDLKHPEVLFAAYLREHYLSSIHAEVFSNHQGKQALRHLRDLLDTDHDGLLTPAEKEQARIIIYGHSWGASQAIGLARQLERENIPVLLTIQVDSVHKPGLNDSRIPANVEAAVNFFQAGGLLHGRSQILTDDPLRTRILGNYRMTYQGQRIDCSNYPWLVRVFNKPHHKIENDPRVWGEIASLIDSELSISR